MKNNKKTLLQLAAATFGAGVLAVTIFIGGVNEKGIPDPITVDNQTIEFTWTDENANEDLIIWTDSQNYNNGLSNATVYAAVQNKSGVDQSVELMGYFVNDRRRIEEVSVLTEVTKQGEELFETVCKPPEDKKATTTEECNDVSAGFGPDIVTNEWLPLETAPRDVYEEAKESANLQKKTLARKPVDGYVATKKTLQYTVPADGVVYYKMKIDYPVNDAGNFFLEAIGSEGGYGHLDPWFNASWGYRVKITIDDTKVPSTQTSFPVFVDLADLPSSFFTNAKSDGCDIRVVESDETTETAFELVSYSANATGTLHFMADSLTGSGGGDTEFYIYYGNAGASCYAVTDTYGRNNVWTAYASVYHFEHSSGNATDSTSAGLTITNNGTTAYTINKLGKGPDLGTSNSTKYFDRGSAGFAGGNFTFTAWVKIRTEPTSGQVHQILVPRKNTPHAIDAIMGYRNVAGTKEIVFDRGKSGIGSFEVKEVVTLGTSDWHHLHMTYDGTTLRGYRNGTSVGTPLTTSGNGGGGGNALVVGGYGGSRVSAYLDEVRIRNSAVSADWITTEYNNQSKNTFMTIGSEEPQGGGAGRRIFMIE